MIHGRTVRLPPAPGPLILLLTAIIALSGAICPPTATAAAEDLDLWFTIEIAGQKAGWQRLTVTTEDDRITTTTQVHMNVRRGRDTATVTFAGEFVETAAGQPVQMRRRGDSGRTPMISEYTFEPGTIRIVSRPAEGAGEPGAAAQESETALPEGSWLPPAAARQYVAQRLEAGAKQITVRTMDPSLGPQAITVSRDVIEKTRASVGPPGEQREIDVWRCSVRQSVAEDLHTVEYLDARGIPVMTETKLGGLDMRFALSDQATAQRAAPAPEMLVSVLVRPTPPWPIAQPRRTTEAVYRVRTLQGPLPDLPGAGGQRFERLGDQSAQLRVSSEQWTAAGEVDAEALLAPSQTLDTGDETLQKLARRATAAAGDSDGARAEAMRRFVHQHVRTKNLDVVFARASEVARTREGDCTEHATLLAALLRIEGIPSRVVSGLIYTERFAGEEHIFAYHMWTQALLEIDGEQRWVDLDATLSDQAFDAAHIAVSTSDLSGETGPLDAMLVIAQLIGNLEIHVEEAR